jgi:hypothetical protein
MSYNSLILNKLDADRYMANLLDKALLVFNSKPYNRLI